MTGVTLKIDFETEALQQALARLKRRGGRLRPALLVIGEYLRSIPAHAGKPKRPHGCGRRSLLIRHQAVAKPGPKREKGNIPQSGQPASQPKAQYSASGNDTQKETLNQKYNHKTSIA